MTVVDEPTTKVIGQRLLRREDPALLTGEARFTNDLSVNIADATSPACSGVGLSAQQFPP